MSVEANLADLLESGLQLWVENGRLRYRVRTGGLTAERRQFLERYREAIITLLGEGTKLAPTAFAQGRLWLVEELGERAGAYHIPLVLELQDPLAMPALAAAAAALVVRHEVLRTTFRRLDGRPFQVVARAPALPAVPFVDLGGLPAAARRDTARRLAAAAAARPFDLERGPLLRLQVIGLGGDVHWLLATFHHAVADGGSLAIFRRELAALLAAAGRGAVSPLAPLPGQYADFAAWQRGELTEEVLADQLAWWRRQLAGTAALELPADRPPATAADGRAAGTAFVLPRELGESLRRRSTATGTSLFVTCLAGFAALLHRWTGQRDLALGTPVDQRRLEELEGLIGFFVNTVVVRARVRRGAGFAALADEVRAAVIGAQDHQDVPFERLVRELAPERAPDLHPLFRVSFVLDAAARSSEVELGEEVEIPFLRVAFDLELRLEDAGELRGILAAPRARFDATTLERWTRSYGRLLAAAAAAPDRPLGRLDLLGRGERHQLLAEWNVGRCPGPVVAPLHALFEARAAARPEAVAVSAEGRELTYGELDRRANRLAHHLARRGVGREDLVAFLLERSPAAVVAMVAILKAGGAYLPLDPTSPPQRLVELLADAGAALLVTDSPWRRQLSAVAVPIVELDTAAAAIAACPATPPARAADPAQLAYVIYTSGSTGRPKGVAVTHANVVRLFATTRKAFAFGAGDVWSLFHSLAFDFAVWETWGALAHGGRLVLVSYLTSRSPDDILDLLERERVTVLDQTPSAFRMLLRAVAARPCRLALRWVVFGGEALVPASLRPWFERYGDRRPRLVNMYGITETTVHVTRRVLSWAEARQPGIGSPIGGPLDDLELYVLDGAGEPLPAGTAGELFVGGAGLARGYLGRPALTAGRFLPSPFARRPGERLYRTGDRVRRRADGELDYLGRLDRQVKIRGFRIEPGEIEAILESHGHVERCAVLVRGAANAEADERRLVAYVVACTGRAPAAAELRTFLAARLPPPMVPAHFVTLPALPLTAHGKVDRDALPEPPAGRFSAAAGRPPHGPLEIFLAECWCSVLGRERVGAEEGFFAAGGDSILALRLVARIRHGGYALSLPQLFLHPTVAELARIVAPVRADEELLPTTAAFALVDPADRPFVAGDLDDAYPLTRLQAGMIYHSELAPDRALYHDVLTFHVRGAGDPEALGSALAELSRRHPVLRTSFALAGFSEPLQMVHREVAVPFAVTDLRGVAAAEASAAVRDWIEEEKARPFDWQRPPLLRCRLFRRGDDSFDLGLGFHHALLDGWSAASLATELLRLHAAARAGAPWPAPAPAAVAFRDFVACERRLLATPAAERFWRETLLDAPTTRLPRSTPRLPPAVTPQANGAAEVEIAVSPVVEAGLRRLAAAAGAPLKSVLLAAHVRVLGHLAGAADVVTGLVANGRPEAAGSDRVAGLFLNTLPLRCRLTGGSWTALVRDVYQAELAAFPYRAFPLAEIERLLDRGPLFETAFNFTHFHVFRDLDEAGGLEILEVGGYEQTNFALVVDGGLAPAGGGLGLRLSGDGAVGSAARVAAWADLYADVLDAMAFLPEERYERWTAPAAAAGPEPPGSEPAAPDSVEAPPMPVSSPPPATAAEAWLAELFARLLGREEVGTRDDFFDLGGHSLLALRLMAEIERRCGRRLPLATLLSTPTVAGLARLIAAAAAGPASPLVVIRPGGSRPPVFWAHAADGQVLAYRELARRLAPGRPVYGLVAEADDRHPTGTELTDAGMAAMAERYLQTIRERQSRGPYFLGGWSLGGVVAFEVARRLEHEGEEVGLLALLHSVAPAGATPRCLAGRTALFLPRGEAAAEGEITAGWQRLMGRGLELVPCPGNHYTMLREPHAQELAALLDRCLRRAGG